MDLFQLSSQAKMGAVKEYTEYLAEAKCRFFLFAYHKQMLDELQKSLEKHNITFVRIDDSTSSKQREELVDEFRTSIEVQVALLSVTACYAGLNFQADCSTVVFAEMHWTPDVLTKAE